MEHHPEFLEYCSITGLSPSERDEAIFLAGYTFAQIEVAAPAKAESARLRDELERMRNAAIALLLHMDNWVCPMPDEKVLMEALNESVNHAREYIRSDRQEKREWKGWTLDEFDAACERLDALRKPTETKEPIA